MANQFELYQVGLPFQGSAQTCRNSSNAFGCLYILSHSSYGHPCGRRVYDNMYDMLIADAESIVVSSTGMPRWENRDKAVCISRALFTYFRHHTHTQNTQHIPHAHESLGGAAASPKPPMIHLDKVTTAVITSQPPSKGSVILVNPNTKHIVPSVQGVGTDQQVAGDTAGDLRYQCQSPPILCES